MKNPVRKHIWSTSKPKVEKDKSKYTRKKKHKVVDNTGASA